MIPALMVHLGQSTLFAAIAGLLTLALRSNAARIRYWFWLAASCKFLVPFSWLVTLGRQIHWRTTSPLAAAARPFLIPRPSPPFPIRVAMPPAASSLDLEPLLVALWLCGTGMVLLYWYVRWRRLRITLRSATPLPFRAPIPVMTSAALLEPGVFGIFHPVLLLPDGITGRLAPQEFQAILAHEFCHVRRRDNLAAVIHMLVEAVFWFHPLVWWLGTRIVEERERACDEEVLESQTEPETYAAAILKVCQFYVESPLICAAGVTGANLKKRIEAIMTHRTAEKLGKAKKALLAMAGAAALTVPILAGMLDAPPLRAQSQPGKPLAFEVASVKENKSSDLQGLRFEFLPGGKLAVRNLPLIIVIAAAYDLPLFNSDRLTGGPDWVRRNRYDIEATAESGAVPSGTSVKARDEKIRLMLQTLLAERFKLNIRRETRELPLYAVVVAKGGPKLQKAAVEEKDCAEKSTAIGEPANCHSFEGGQGRGLHAQAVSISDIALAVSNWTDRPVVDRTALAGLFSIQTEGWAPMRPRPARPPGQEPSAEDLAFADPARPTLFQIFDRLGLKLEAQRGPVEMFVIENAEKPTEN